MFFSKLILKNKADDSVIDPYSYGIYFDDTCNPIAYNHAVTLVGYGILNLVDIHLLACYCERLSIW